MSSFKSGLILEENNTVTSVMTKMNPSCSFTLGRLSNLTFSLKFAHSGKCRKSNKFGGN